MKVKSEREVAQSCPTLSNPMDRSLLGPLSMGISRQEYWSGIVLLPTTKKKKKSVDVLIPSFSACDFYLEIRLLHM